VQSSIKGAKLTRDAAALDLQTAIDAALLEVRTKFYNVILAREKIRVEEENVHLYEHQLSDTKNQFDAGTVSNFEVLRAKVYLANAQPNLITARNSYRIAVEQLRQSLGTPLATTFPEVAGDLNFETANYELDAAIAAAHAHRPELQKLEKLESATAESVTTARSTYYPSLQAFGAYEWDGFTFVNSQLGNVNANGWLFGLQSKLGDLRRQGDGRQGAPGKVPARAVQDSQGLRGAGGRCRGPADALLPPGGRGVGDRLPADDRPSRRGAPFGGCEVPRRIGHAA